MLSAISSAKTPPTIGKIMGVAVCDYRKFQDRQISCGVYLTQKHMCGATISQREHFTLDIYQQACDRAIINTAFELKSLFDIVLDYLMPEAEITLYLYPQKKEVK